MIEVAVFDAYGTLFDVHAAVRRHGAALGERGPAVSALWRARQLEYSWVRSLAGRYADFWQVTQDALDHALASVGVADPALRARLLDAYLELDPYAEVPAVLQALRAAGVRCAILSNGTAPMLARAVAAGALGDLFEAVLSVDEIGVYKPDPRVYALAAARLGAAPAAIAFQSSNAWDAAGAAVAGFRVHWINRQGQPREYADLGPVTALPDLSGLPALLRPAARP